MSLDLCRLENPRRAGGKIIARCPACAASGEDESCEHLVIYDGGNGKFGCIVFSGDGPDAKAHRRRIAELVGLERPRSAPPAVIRRKEPETRAVQLPQLRIPTVGELAQLAHVRKLPTFAGLELASRAGRLRTAAMRDGTEIVDAWIVLDSSRRCAQARRLDGKPWQAIGAKAKTLPGAIAAWPIGAADISGKPSVLLCEGAPDFLAGWELLWWHGMHREVAPCCVAGSHAIHADALPVFRGKQVYLVPHRDPKGEKARNTWTNQLRDAEAAEVHAFDVAPHKDLNDYLAAEVQKEFADAF